MLNTFSHAGRRRPGVLVLLFSSLLILGACSSFDPTEPGDDSQPSDLPTSRDELVDLFFTAQAERDGARLASTFGDGVVFTLDPEWVAAAGLEASTLIREDLIAASGHLCSGLMVVDDGHQRPPVSGILVDAYTPIDATWTPVGVEGYGDVAERRYDIQMRVAFAGADELTIAGEVLFRAAAWAEGGTPGATRKVYDIVGLVDGTFPADGGDDEGSLSQLWRHYVGNESPTAILTRTTATPVRGELVRFSAAASRDPEGNFPPRPYRWRASSDGAWSEWSAEPDFAAVYPDDGRYTVSLQVRDRWDRTDTGYATVNVGTVPYHPYTDPDAVYLNYNDILESMDIEECDHALSAGFAFVGTEREFSYRPTELATMGNIFGGESGRDAEGNPEAPVSHVIFMLTPVGIWQDIPADHTYFGGITGLWRDFMLVASFERAGSTRLEVQGIVCMFLDKVAGAEGVEYRVLGFVDSTEPLVATTESASWTQVKQRYR